MARKSYQKGSIRYHRGCWTVRYRYLNNEGKMEQRTSKLTHAAATDPRNRKAARREADRFMLDINRHNSSPHRSDALTLARFISTYWADYLTATKVADSTRSVYSTVVDRYIIPRLGEKLLAKLTPADMTALFNSLPVTLSPGYRSNVYNILRRMLEIARQYELIETSPLRPVLHRPKLEPKPKPTLTLEEVRRVIDALREEYRLMFLILWVTGMRLGEVIALRWLNLNTSTGELAITHSVWRGRLKEPKTGPSRRTFVLPSVIVKMLVALRQSSPFAADGDFIFARPDGRPQHPNTIRDCVLYPAMDAIGIKRTSRTHGAHIFRHTAGSVVHARTGDLKLVQSLLGHSRIETTGNIYVHVDESGRGRASDLLLAELVETQGTIS